MFGNQEEKRNVDDKGRLKFCGATAMIKYLKDIFELMVPMKRVPKIFEPKGPKNCDYVFRIVQNRLPLAFIAMLRDVASWPGGTLVRIGDRFLCGGGMGQISEIERYLTYGERIVIPSSLRNNILKSLHFAHPGIVRMQAIARNHVYWPGIDSEIERVVKQCEECHSASKNPTNANLQPWKGANGVFERIHIDFAVPCADGQTYLVLVDAYSKWPEVWQMERTSSQLTILENFKQFQGQ
ncbi:hypothetical protein niasHT_003269 [Heterodera trifolii]|uniref:RNA-directed DNA polymerase n=1 Tax=Heterodera trifolii TaxID=157864 RepID=A0ABD2LSI8_9BILA